MPRTKKAETKKTETKKTDERERADSKHLVIRLPVSVGASLKGEAVRRGRDWTPLRELLEKWAEEGDYLEAEVPEEKEQVCFAVSTKTASVLEQEAERLTEETGKKWTVSMVVHKIWEEHREEAPS